MKIVFFTGAGISAESGIKTFRDSNGLWEEHDIYEVATPEGWERNPALVNSFYNARRLQMASVNPNEAHLEIARLEKEFDITVITQNIDDLHERAGSQNVIHLHGELKYARSSTDASLLYDYSNKTIEMGDTCEKGSQLRPHVVWFGEMVPMLPVAEELVSKADFFIIVGTSMQVYPAAGLVSNTPQDCQRYYIDPSPTPLHEVDLRMILKEKASSGVPKLASILRNQV